MLMWLRMAPALHLIFLLIIHRFFAANCDVTYSTLYICALQNSTMTIICNYTYPDGLKVMKAFWNIDQVYYEGDFADLSTNSEYSQRLQYLGDKQENCTVRLSHVTKKDEHVYYFRFVTNVEGQKWIGIPGVRLSVTDLQLESPERVTEGDSVRLTCKSSCKLTDTPTFIWYRNSHILTNIGDELNIRSVSRREAGHYSCGVQGQTYISPAVYLNVTYAPDTPVISISGSAVIMEGDSVTLSCSSDSNPPAQISWFKGETSVGSGRIFNISKISSDDSGEYKCSARNDHGEKISDPVTLDVQYPPKSISVSISGSAVIMSGDSLFSDSVSLMCISDSNPPALSFSWFKENQSSAVGSGQSFSAVQSGRFYCEAHNPHGAQRSDAVTVTVQQHAVRNIVITATSGGLFIIVVIIMFAILSKRRSRRSAVKSDRQKICNESATYAGLDLQTVTSNLYDTLTTVHHRPAENSCSTLDPQSSSEHHNPPINRRRLQ
nr:B-cell receptor CD22-like [Danio rerio]|eukprot:XP_017212278.1 B-cell receptor CD22-like [Danio rerio]